MNIGNKLSILALATALGSLIVPAFANGSGGSQGAPDQGMSMGHMGQGMMRGGMISRGMMGSGCSEMMQSMNSSRPNSQWQKHQDNGG